MIVDLSEIKEAQIILDEAIQKKHHVSYNAIFEELKLALLVELGELANEVRCFKFWSLKAPSDRKVILEEYVDGIHFISSICIAKKVEMVFEIDENIKLLNKQELTKSFNELFAQMDFLNTSDGIKKWYCDYLSLGYALGFKFDDIYRAYFEKNQINFKRQEQNY